MPLFICENLLDEIAGGGIMSSSGGLGGCVEFRTSMALQRALQTAPSNPFRIVNTGLSVTPIVADTPSWSRTLLSLAIIKSSVSLFR
jgi:hypothetical protein